MKKITLLVIAMYSLTALQAQSKSGIATYTVPAGWKSSMQESTVLLEYAVKKGDTCQIRLMKTEPVAITTKEIFAKARSARSGKGVAYSNDPASISLSELNGIVSLSSRSIADPAKPDQRLYIYSFSNKQESFFVQLYCNNINTCKESMNAFLTSLLVDSVATDEPAAKAKADGTKAKRRKAAPAAPAAPAPMM